MKIQGGNKETAISRRIKKKKKIQWVPEKMQGLVEMFWMDEKQKPHEEMHRKNIWIQTRKKISGSWKN